MRTTVDIDQALLDEVEKFTGETSVTKAVNRGLSEFVRLAKLARLREMIGRVELEDNWRELKRLELEELKRLEQ